MNEKVYSFSVIFGHQGRSVMHNNELSKMVKEGVVTDVYKSRNEWMKLIRPITDHKESRHIVSTSLFVDGVSYTEIIRLYAPHTPRPELSFYLFNLGRPDFSEDQVAAEYLDVRKKMHQYLPAAAFDMTNEHHSTVTDCLDEIIQKAKEDRFEFRIGDIQIQVGGSRSNLPETGVSLYFPEHALKDNTVKLAMSLTPTGRPHRIKLRA